MSGCECSTLLSPAEGAHVSSVCGYYRRQGFVSRYKLNVLNFITLCSDDDYTSVWIVNQLLQKLTTKQGLLRKTDAVADGLSVLDIRTQALLDFHRLSLLSCQHLQIFCLSKSLCRHVHHFWWLNSLPALYSKDHAPLCYVMQHNDDGLTLILTGTFIVNTVEATAV